MANKGDMPILSVKNLNIHVPVNDTTRPLLFSLQANFVDWMHACGGKGRCTTCKMQIINGQENTSADTPA